MRSPARPGDLAAIRRIDSRQVQRAVGQGADQHRRSGVERRRRAGRAATWPTSIRRRSAARFDGHGTFEFGEPRRFVITNRSTGRTGRGVVPMTGTINATIVGDDYRFDHRNSFPGFDLEGRMSGRINRGDGAARAR